MTRQGKWIKAIRAARKQNGLCPYCGKQPGTKRLASGEIKPRIRCKRCADKARQK